MPPGGFRVGSGRKSLGERSNWLRGNPGKRNRRRPGEAVVTPSGDVARPRLPAAVADVWDRLAPLAIGVGTLTPATVQAFADLCAYIVLEEKLRANVDMACRADHRGLMLRIETQRARFRLLPDGREPDVDRTPNEPHDPFAEFEAGKTAEAIPDDVETDRGGLVRRH